MGKKKVVKEKIVEKISVMRRIYNAVMVWLVGTGIDGVIGALAGLILLAGGYQVLSGIAFGVFATRNWDILRTWIKK
tara:strand:+ start:3575 stop:3805 length:231 start_codon:yes stop_codon:yes gene_type:complete